MRETRFIDQNKEKWKEFERLLNKRDKDPDKLANLFIEVTDDLAYARSFYPNRSVKAYLNQLAQRIYQSIYKNKKSLGKRFKDFWVEDMPRYVWEARKEFLLSLGIFLMAMLIGIFSSTQEPEFARYILGDRYVNMTEANIEKGDPMAVYKSSKEIDMFLRITINNVYVAVRTFLFGVLSAIGTVFILLYNGIMVGAFQFFFIERGLFWESFSVIWLHGTIEISSIIISGAAGITMGRGILFPGTYTRFQAFTNAARRGFKIFLGVVPLFILAALIESFITRYTDAPDVFKIALIATSALFIIGYFVVYPIYKRRTGFKHTTQEPAPRTGSNEPINLDQVKTNGTIYGQAFMIYKKYFGKMFLLGLGLTALYLVAINLSISEQLFGNITAISGVFIYLRNFNVFFSYGEFPMLLILQTITFGIMTGLGGYAIQQTKKNGRITNDFSWKEFGRYLLKRSPAIMLIIVFTQLVFFIPNSLSWLLFLAITPFAFMWLFQHMRIQKRSVFAAAGSGFSLAASNLGRLLGLNLMIFLSMFIFILLVNSPVFWTYFNFLNEVILLSTEQFEFLLYNLLVVTIHFSLLLGFPLLAIAMGLQNHNLFEISEAFHLKQRIKKLDRS